MGDILERLEADYAGAVGHTVRRVSVANEGAARRMSERSLEGMRLRLAQGAFYARDLQLEATERSDVFRERGWEATRFLWAPFNAGCGVFSLPERAGSPFR